MGPVYESSDVQAILCESVFIEGDVTYKASVEFEYLLLLWSTIPYEDVSLTSHMYVYTSLHLVQSFYVLIVPVQVCSIICFNLLINLLCLLCYLQGTCS